MLVEVPETVTPNPAYVVGGAISATVTITSNE